MPGPEEVAKETFRRATLLDRLLRTNIKILRELDIIQDKLLDRPTRADTTYRRRAGIVVLVAGIVASMWVTDWHVEHCGPGHRSELIVNALLKGQIKTNADFAKIAERPKPVVCGLFFPLHSHVDGEKWPTRRNKVGIVGFALLAILMIVWTRRPLRWDHPSGYEDRGRGGPDDDDPEWAESTAQVNEDIAGQEVEPDAPPA